MTEVITSSPVVTRPAISPATKFFNFYDALKHVANEAASIAREIWTDENSRVTLYDSRLMLLDVKDNLWHPWTIHTSDLAAEDWYILPI